MAYAVVLTTDAAREVRDIDAYIAWRDSVEAACSVVEGLGQVVAGLGENPQWGNYPKELLALGVQEFREMHFKPYRVIYRVIDKTVYILCVADGRRNIQRLLLHRLLRID
jgi:toxin ParE1/3/4